MTAFLTLAMGPKVEGKRQKAKGHGKRGRGSQKERRNGQRGSRRKSSAAERAGLPRVPWVRFDVSRVDGTFRRIRAHSGTFRRARRGFGCAATSPVARACPECRGFVLNDRGRPWRMAHS